MFADNSAGERGGAIDLQFDVGAPVAAPGPGFSSESAAPVIDLAVTNCLFLRNRAGVVGGAISLSSTDYNVTSGGPVSAGRPLPAAIVSWSVVSSTFTNNVVTCANTTLCHVGASGMGGAMHVYLFDVDYDLAVSVYTSTFVGNTVAGLDWAGGGAISVLAYDSCWLSSLAVVVDGSAFADNSARAANSSNPYTGAGGALYVESAAIGSPRRAVQAAGGVGVGPDAVPVTMGVQVTGCNFTRNSGEYTGGAVST